jgi:hypothetical protein
MAENRVGPKSRSNWQKIDSLKKAERKQFIVFNVMSAMNY